jgi:histidyl-tRNA synthetase
MRDESPDEFERRSALAAAILREMRLFGYRQVATPALEKKELFVRGLGSETDAVSKELYCVDEETALRPENTAGAVRMFVEGAYGWGGGARFSGFRWLSFFFRLARFGSSCALEL